MSDPGPFCTSVLRTSDPDRAAHFYTSLLGWTTQPAAPDHTFLQFDGKTVASIQRIASGHDGWVPHVCVDALERTIEAATALGATPLDVTDVPGVARLATLRDREAAAFGLWQPDPHRGAEQTDVLGSIWDRGAGSRRVRRSHREDYGVQSTARWGDVEQRVAACPGEMAARRRWDHSSRPVSG